MEEKQFENNPNPLKSLAFFDQGACYCSKCYKEYFGRRQTKEQKEIWLSPCCKAKAKKWFKIDLVEDK